MTPEQWKREFPGLSAIIDRMTAADPKLTQISAEKLHAALASMARGGAVPQEIARKWDRAVRRATAGDARWSMPA
jgi:hypothetical protein